MSYGAGTEMQKAECVATEQFSVRIRKRTRYPGLKMQI